MNRYPTIVCVLIGMLAALPAIGRILNVPDDFQTIRAGVEAAENGDTVIVAPGRYQETITFSGNNIVVASQFLLTGDERLIGETIIDGADGGGHSVVAIREGEADGAELAGFTITGGATDYGGGVYCTGTSPYLHHLIIEGNHATHNGGGLYTTQNARVLCQNSIIRNNTADFGGGGLTCYFSARTVIEDCIISGNEGNYGGGVQCSQSAELVMRGCTISENDGTDGESAGGVWAWNNASVTLENCSVIGNIADWTSGFRIWRTNMFLDHVLIAGNEGRELITYESENENQIFSMTNVTIADNQYSPRRLLYLVGPGISLTNSILLVEEEDFPVAILNGALTVAYSMISNRDSLFSISQPEWGEGVFDEDPQFIDRENGDYHLIPGSPCIDTGDPEAENDPDGTRRDIGAFAYSQRIAWIGGRVTDLISGDPLPWALAVISRDGASLFSLRTDEDGRWGRWLTLPEDEVALSLSVTCARYTSFQQDFVVGNGDSLTLEAGLGTGVLSVSEDTLAVGVVEGAPRTLPIEIRNSGNAPLRWRSSWHGLGSMANVPGEVVRSVQLLPLVDDDRISGVAFDGENYYLAGANGQDSSMIYVLDRNFEYVREFEQPCHTRYGMKDLEWDGQLLWGSGDSSIYAFSTNGDLVHRFRGPYNPNTNIAYEPDRGVLWVSGVTTSIIACDFEGNILDTLARKALRIYGLAWDAGDPDGYNLQILSYPRLEQPLKIYKMNAETGDTILVTDLTATDGESGIEGLFMSPDNHRNGSASALFIRNITSNFGGDQLSEVILRPNLEWFDISPVEGMLEPGAASTIEAHMLTRGELTDWMFEPGDYEAEVIITHDGREGEARVPIRLSVSPNYAPGEVTPSTPSDFSFTSVFPQPFNSSLEIGYRLNRASVVKLSLIDLAGREVAAIAEGYRPAGENRTTFDAIAIPSGIYMARLESGGAVAMVKAICLK